MSFRATKRLCLVLVARAVEIKKTWGLDGGLEVCFELKGAWLAVFAIGRRFSCKEVGISAGIQLLGCTWAVGAYEGKGLAAVDEVSDRNRYAAILFLNLISLNFTGLSNL